MNKPIITFEKPNVIKQEWASNPAIFSFISYFQSKIKIVITIDKLYNYDWLKKILILHILVALDQIIYPYFF